MLTPAEIKPAAQDTPVVVDPPAPRPVRQNLPFEEAQEKVLKALADLEALLAAKQKSSLVLEFHDYFLKFVVSCKLV